MASRDNWQTPPRLRRRVRSGFASCCRGRRSRQAHFTRSAYSGCFSIYAFTNGHCAIAFNPSARTWSSASLISTPTHCPRSILQGVGQHAADRPGFAVAGAADIVDLPLSVIADEIVADGVVDRFGARRAAARDGDRDHGLVGVKFFGNHLE